MSAPALPEAADTLAEQVLLRTEEIAVIPAPTGEEGARAACVARWWRAEDLTVRTDAAGNVWAAVGTAGEGASRDGAIVLAAHLDTVFPAHVPHVVRREGGRLLGPSVADDSIALAALASVAALLAPMEREVWLLATVGEEGLGNLRGITAALEGWTSPPAAVLAVEGNYLGRVSATGVGSVRWRVELGGPGGHAWEARFSPSAVHIAAEIVGRIAGLSAPEARTSVNVGRIEGGEAINSRARACLFELDIRADTSDALQTIEFEARSIIDAALSGPVEVDIVELGRRPAGALDPGHALVRSAVTALEAVGIAPELVATSTDANAAHARGIPAVAVGITTGGGEHTPQEWIDVEPVARGLSVLAQTVMLFEEASR